MKYKRIFIESSKNYAAKIIRNPHKNWEFKEYSTLRWHKEYELIYVEKGHLQIKKIDKIITISAGEICLLNSEEVHAYCKISSDAEYIIVTLRKNAVSPYISYIENSNEIISFKLNNEFAINNILNSLKTLFNLPQFDNSVETIKIRAILHDILYYLIKYCVDDNANYVLGSSYEEIDYAKIAIDYMYLYYKDNITLNKIAEYVGLSSSHFSKYFKEKTNVTFSKYLRCIRLEKALLDMSKNGVSVKEAAINNGFPNVNSFIVSCKEMCNRTPLETINFMLS